MSEYLPCYAIRINTDIRCNTKQKIKDYIDVKLDKWKHEERFNTGIVVISVTEQDPNWKLWIKVLQTYPQVTFTRTRTKYHDGNYWCFLACIPCSPE